MRIARAVGPAMVVVALAVAGVLAWGGGTGAGPGAQGPGVTKAELKAYLAQIEPPRLAVNRLLDTADPILETYNDMGASPADASRQIGDLEMKFAGEMLTIDGIELSNRVLRAINAPYAHTYLLEDTYLATLASDMGDGDRGDDFDNLPTTQIQQRRAIIEWRTQVELLARRVGLRLPADLQQAGRGEIAPAPSGS